VADSCGSPDPYNVFFLCGGNSARSIMAEASLKIASAKGRFRAFSAGSHLKGRVHGPFGTAQRASISARAGPEHFFLLFLILSAAFHLDMASLQRSGCSTLEMNLES
jgi:hypothetical protein